MDQRAHGTDVGSPLGLAHQRLDRSLVDERVVVEEHHVVGSGLQRGADADVVPVREADVLLAADHLDLGECGADGLGCAVRRAVVHDDQAQAVPAHALQRAQALDRVVAPVQDEHDDRHMRLSFASHLAPDPS